MLCQKIQSLAGQLQNSGRNNAHIVSINPGQRTVRKAGGGRAAWQGSPTRYYIPMHLTNRQPCIFVSAGESTDWESGLAELSKELSAERGKHVVVARDASFPAPVARNPSVTPVA
jgi:hypothetical protein